ncbi:MAG: permease-like cell division protein FtsX [Erysipelotrichaceae bacterium]|jgi:cell division transport system permease protein
MFRRIGRAFKEAWWGISRHLAMVISTAITITITLLILSVLILLISNVNQITYAVEEEIQIFVKIDKAVEEEDIDALKTKVSRIAGVAAIEYSDADSELTHFIEQYGEAGEMFNIYREDNPLSRAFIISVSTGYSISEVARQIEIIDGIAEANFGGATIEQFISLLNGIRKVGLSFTLGLAILAVVLIFNTIKITIHSRREEIGIMRLVGATNSYIRVPLVLEGIFIGFFGSIFPCLVTVFGYNYVYEMMDGHLVSGILRLKDVFPFTLYVCGLVMLVGIFVGWIGSWLSATVSLRTKR